LASHPHLSEQAVTRLARHHSDNLHLDSQHLDSQRLDNHLDHSAVHLQTTIPSAKQKVSPDLAFMLAVIRPTRTPPVAHSNSVAAIYPIMKAVQVSVIPHLENQQPLWQLFQAENHLLLPSATRSRAINQIRMHPQFHLYLS